MNKFRIQRYQTTVTIPVNNDTADAPAVDQLNGILKGVTLVAPALTGTAYTLSILGQRGEVLFSKAALVEAVNTHINVDANNRPLELPLSLAGVAPVRIKSTGTPDATGELTFSNAGAIVDGQTITIGDHVYTFVDTLAEADDVLIEADVKAQGLITLSGAGPSDTNTIVIGAKTYRFVNVLAQANDIKIEADIDDTLANLKAAINGAAGEGTAYGTGTTANADVEATTLDDVAHTLIIEAQDPGLPGNSIVFTESADNTAVDGAGTLGTTQAGAWSGDLTLANLADAINGEDGGGEEGTKYGTGTVANAYVTAGAVASHAITLTAVDEVDDPADVDTLSTTDEMTFGAATLEGGGEAVQRVFNVDLLIDRG